MASRAVGSMPSLRIHPRTDSGSSANRWAAKECCRSRSDSMTEPRDPVRLGGFGLEGCKRGNIRVPLDEGRHPAEAFHGRGVQGPDFIAHVSAVGIDADVALLHADNSVSSQVNLPDSAAGNS